MQQLNFSTLENEINYRIQDNEKITKLLANENLNFSLH